MLLVHNMSSENKEHPWKNGYWIDRKDSSSVAYINGENIEFFSHVYLDHPELKPEAETIRKLEYGDFGPAPLELTELSGIQNFNLRLEINEFKLRLILNDEGKRFYGKITFQYVVVFLCTKVFRCFCMRLFRTRFVDRILMWQST